MAAVVATMAKMTRLLSGALRRCLWSFRTGLTDLAVPFFISASTQRGRHRKGVWSSEIYLNHF